MALVDWEAAAANSKVCNGPCGRRLDVEQFALYSKGQGLPKIYRRARCNECRAADFRELATTDKRKRQQRDAWLRRKYGITIEQYETMLAAQDGCCAVCRSKPGDRTLAVDHCHETDVVRGLLCDSCNNGIGRFQDDSDLLRAAARYLDGTC